MQYEIITRSLDVSDMWRELSFVSKHLQQLGEDRCFVIFGFAWGSEYYDGGLWKEVEIPIIKLAEEVGRVQQAGLGSLGSDDLFIRVPQLEIEFHFCNDSDIHLSYEQPSELSEFFYENWKSKGFSPFRRSLAPEAHEEEDR
jgi:hypothetical protein